MRLCRALEEFSVVAVGPSRHPRKVTDLGNLGAIARMMMIGALAATPLGCFGAPSAPADRPGGQGVGARRAVDIDTLPRVDLTGGNPVRPGYGRLRVVVDQHASGRRIQAADQRLILVVTRPGGGEVEDEFGQPAVYSVTASGGLFTITLPGLPPTTTAVGGSLSSSAYVLSALIGNWDAFVAPTSYTDLTSGILAYGSQSEGTFTLSSFGLDMVSSDLEPDTDSMLLSSGFARADITSGVSPTVTIQTYTHWQKHFQNSPVAFVPQNPGPATFAQLIATGSANVISMSNLTIDDEGELRLRNPAFNPGEVDLLPVAVGSIPANRRVARLTVFLTGSETFSTAPTVTVKVRDVAAGTTSALDSPVEGQALTLFQSGATNEAFSLAGKLAYLDLDLSGPVAQGEITVSGLVAATYNVVDFALAGLPAGAAARVYLAPLGTAYIMSGPSTPNAFE